MRPRSWPCLFRLCLQWGAIYGDSIQGPQSEAHPEKPASPYGISKHTIDHYLRVIGQQRGLAWVSMRFANAYGPRQGMRGEAGVVGTFSRRLQEGQPLVINGDGLQTRDFIHAKDLALSAVKALDQRATGVFNFGTGKGTSILQLAQKIQTVAGIYSGIEFVSAYPGEQRHSVLCALKAEKELGWTPTLELTRGLEDTWAWFQQQKL